jgi:hypothetical protein
MLQTQHSISFFLKFMSSLQVKSIVFLLNDAFATEIMDLLSLVHQVYLLFYRPN